MEDLKRDYLIKTFSRTKRKDYENYVIGSIWHKLNNINIKPVTQQFVSRGNGHYALLDMYFPQINYAVEVDEAQHLNNKENDLQRELDVDEMLSAISNVNIEFGRVDITKSLGEINDCINNIVVTIKQKYTEAGSPIWIITDPVDYARSRKSITVEDNLEFDNLYKQIRRLFGKKEYQNSRVRCTFDVSRGDTKAFVWCPKLAIKDSGGMYTASDPNWENTISPDLNYIYEKFVGEKKSPMNDRYGPTSKNSRKTYKRYAFAKERNCLGEKCYKFLGVFEFESLESNTATFKKVSDTIDLTPYTQGL